MKPLIGILSNITLPNENTTLNIERVFVGKTYIEAVEKSGGIPIVVPVNTNEENIRKIIEVVDGIIISGGVDVNPVLYNEEPIEELGYIHPDIDEFDLLAIKIAIELKKPIFGICRGAQIINVALGGSLYQDISYAKSYLKHFQEAKSYVGTHYIEVVDNSVLYEILGKKILVNSYHHQSIKELGKGLKPIAYSKDGIVEAIQGNDDKFILGVQWHPEMMASYDENMLGIFKMFIEITKQKVTS